MPITLGLNIASLGAQRKLGNTSDGLSKIFERLSSGMRINRASDAQPVLPWLPLSISTHAFRIKAFEILTTASRL